MAPRSSNQVRTIRYCLGMPPEGSASLFGGIVSRRDARLLFRLVILPLVGAISSLWTAFLAALDASVRVEGA